MTDDRARTQKELDDFLDLWERLVEVDELAKKRKQEQWKRFQTMTKDNKQN